MNESMLDKLAIAKPCPANWADMSGDERTRFCASCQKNVYNISEMSRKEVLELIAASDGKFCGRLFRRADGTIITNDCPIGLRLARKAWIAFAAKFYLAAVCISAFFPFIAAKFDKAPNSGHTVGELKSIPYAKGIMFSAYNAVQIYRTSHDGQYPPNASAMLKYMPIDQAKPNGASPYNLDSGWFFKDIAYSDPSNVRKGSVHEKYGPQMVGYAISPSGKDFVILGTDKDGNLTGTNGRPYVIDATTRNFEL